MKFRRTASAMLLLSCDLSLALLHCININPLPWPHGILKGLAPQNKPELQKVMEKRKRDQVLKAQKEEQEAHKKRSDLEIELMKRRETLEQLELGQHKNEEEQENTPEFVKMKSNLRRTKQEVDEQERAT
uniref:Family with sequence similarity 107 member B n=1 Tax=Sinocyclocheilus grahami TaxID=75366 RepID=A0A672LL15_SINGR